MVRFIFCFIFIEIILYILIIITADIKKKLNKEIKVAPCRQLLSGWARLPQYANTPLVELSLPAFNSLQLTVTNVTGLAQDEYVHLQFIL